MDPMTQDLTGNSQIVPPPGSDEDPTDPTTPGCDRNLPDPTASGSDRNLPDHPTPRISRTPRTPQSRNLTGIPIPGAWQGPHGPHNPGIRKGSAPPGSNRDLPDPTASGSDRDPHKPEIRQAPLGPHSLGI